MPDQTRSLSTRLPVNVVLFSAANEWLEQERLYEQRTALFTTGVRLEPSDQQL